MVRSMEGQGRVSASSPPPTGISFALTSRIAAEWPGSGTVALPHGWGHQAAKGLNVANKKRGVNVNLHSPDGPDRIDKVSGMAHLTGFHVDVKPAAGAQMHDWSGGGA